MFDGPSQSSSSTAMPPLVSPPDCVVEALGNSGDGIDMDYLNNQIQKVVKEEDDPDGSEYDAEGSDEENAKQATGDGKEHYNKGNYASAAVCWERTLRSIAYANNKAEFTGRKKREIDVMELTTRSNLMQSYLKTNEYHKGIEHATTILETYIPAMLKLSTKKKEELDEVDHDLKQQLWTADALHKKYESCAGGSTTKENEQAEKSARSPDSDGSCSTTASSREVDTDNEKSALTSSIIDSIGWDPDRYIPGSALGSAAFGKVVYRYAQCLKGRNRNQDLEESVLVIERLTKFDPSNTDALKLRNEILHFRKDAKKREKNLLKDVFKHEIVTDTKTKENFQKAVEGVEEDEFYEKEIRRMQNELDQRKNMPFLQRMVGNLKFAVSSIRLELEQSFAKLKRDLQWCKNRHVSKIKNFISDHSTEGSATKDPTNIEYLQEQCKQHLEKLDKLDKVD